MTAREARDAFLTCWTGDGRRHFRLEEDLLFPAYAGCGDPHDPRVLRALGEHKRSARCFPLIERVMSRDELEAVAHALESATHA